ncbi:MAG: MaoC family dehydratase [Chloroflexi bacterium]|nr:MaoC family dehydratase [Chloroflexota bacterium]
MNHRAVVEKMRSMIGQEIGVSDWFLIDQKRINQFCECTEDNQWIHTDVERAAQGPYGKTIAPGFLALSLISAMSKSKQVAFDTTQVEMLLNYGLNKVRFLNPIFVDSRIRSKMVLTDIEEKTPGRVLVTTRHTIEIESADEPACIVEIVGLFILK